MFEAYSVTSTDYTQNDPIEFQRVRVSDNRIHLTGTTSINIRCPGKYLVKFNGVGSSGTAASPFTLQLYKNDVAVPEAFSTITSTAADNEQTMMFETIVTVNPSCCAVDNTVSLQIIATGAVAGALSLANVVIIKLR